MRYGYFDLLGYLRFTSYNDVCDYFEKNYKKYEKVDVNKTDDIRLKKYLLDDCFSLVSAPLDDNDYTYDVYIFKNEISCDYYFNNELEESDLTLPKPF